MSEEALEESTAALLRATFDDRTRISGRTWLSRRDACVARLFLRGGSATPDSVILKHVPVPLFSADRRAEHHNFLEELAAHRLLSRLGAEQGLKPRLLAGEANGLMLLEDLGPEGNPVRRPLDEIACRIAVALARLHGRTLDREGVYLAERAALGLGPVDEDPRHHGPPKEAQRATVGRDAFMRLAALDADGPALAAVDREFKAVFDLVERYPGHRALVHDDLANARQTFEVGAETYLLDFEYSHYAPPFYDLTKTLLGKFETNIQSGQYCWTCPNLPWSLAERHRALLAQDHGLELADSDWLEIMAACLIYAAMTVTGHLYMVGSQRPLRGTVPQNVDLVLARCNLVIGTLSPFPAIRRTLSHQRVGIVTGTPVDAGLTL